MGGNGEQRGCFRNEHTKGDVDHGTFEASITMSGTEVIIAGTWRFSGGTGTFARVTGNGVFNGKQTSPTETKQHGAEVTISANRKVFTDRGK